MTLWATKSSQAGYGGAPQVDVHVTYGPIVIKVTEDVSHARSFHRELGRLLDETEQANPPYQAEVSVPLATASVSTRAHTVNPHQAKDDN